MPLPDSLATVTEHTLFQRASLGSHDALATLFERHSADVHRVAYRLTLSADEAEDVVQDVFIGLPEALVAFTGSGDFDAWLRKITVRTALMRMRSSKRRAATAARAASGREAAMTNFLLDRMAIETALTALTEDLRVVFMLADMEGFTHAEIGKLLGIRAGASEVRLHRARRKLRALLGER